MKSRQIDYLGTAGATIAVEGSLRTIEHFASFIEGDKTDHQPVTRKVMFAGNGSKAIKKRRRPGYDRSRLREEDKAKEVAQKLEQITLLNWSVEASSHCHMVDEQVRAVLVECCPKVKHAVARKPYISNATFALVE